jgi:hypothetical protein
MVLGVTLGVRSPLAVAQDALRPLVTQPQVDTPLRVLFIGNSLLYHSGGLQTHVHRLGAADKPPLDLDKGYKSVHITGAGLNQYPLDFLVTPGNLGNKEPFQLVVLAGNSADAMTDKGSASYREKVLEFDGIIKKNGGKTALYWLPAMVEPHPAADTDVLRMNEKMIVSMANQIHALVIPVGLAYAEAYKKRPGIKLQVEDGNHPSDAGQYLSACVVYATLYDRSPVGNPYSFFGAIDDNTKLFLQNVALDTVNIYFDRHIQ